MKGAGMKVDYPCNMVCVMVVKGIGPEGNSGQLL